MSVLGSVVLSSLLSPSRVALGRCARRGFAAAWLRLDARSWHQYSTSDLGAGQIFLRSSDRRCRAFQCFQDLGRSRFSSESKPLEELFGDLTIQITEKKSKRQDEDPETRKGASSESEVENEDEGAFSNFPISDCTIQKLNAKGVTYLFPVQSHTFHSIYKGKDVIVQARTGTGKTIAFTIPLVEILNKKDLRDDGRPPLVLVMAPTRELAKQTADVFSSTSDLEVLSVYGGAPINRQISVLRRGVDVIVGTPGRIMDLIERKNLDLTKLQHVVLDEVDRMLDMGFADDVDDILKHAYKNKDRDDVPQTLLFSATLPTWVLNTASKYMKHDVENIDLVGKEGIKTSTTVKHMAIKCSYQARASAIGAILKVYSGNHGRAIVFCETKRDANELACSTHIKQETHVMHGDIPQDKREIVLKGFREGRYKVLVATDVAARGLDIPEVDLVIQCSPPKDIDYYIHRSGRTGRAGRDGVCVLFYKPEEERSLLGVERHSGIIFERVDVPNSEDIVVAAAEDAVRSLDNVSDDALEVFREPAARLMEKRGVEALAAALAVISGNAEIKTRSLITAAEGFTTYLMQTNKEVDQMGYFWRSLERHIPEDVRKSIKNMRFLKDHTGVVFDLPSEFDSTIKDRWQDGRFDTLEKAKTMPEIDEPAYAYGNNRRGGGGGWGRGGGGGGGWGGQKRSWGSNGDSWPS